MVYPPTYSSVSKIGPSVRNVHVVVIIISNILLLLLLLLVP
jgi:hypothetical protein